jgi:hypothetical protein
MDRLTTRIAGEAAMAPEHEEKHTIPEWIDMLHERLAAYEDTGLMPGEVLALKEGCEDCEIARRDWELSHEFPDIDHLRELVKAEKEGRLPPLPCPIGSTVYVIDWCSKMYKGYNCPYGCSGGQREQVFSKRCIKYCRINKRSFQLDYLDRIGKDVFLTKKDAEEELRRRAEGD